MRRSRGLIAGAATLVLGMGVGWWTLATPGAASPSKAKSTLHVIEHASTDTIVDTDGDNQDSTGDLLTFHNKVYDESDSQRVGRDMGECIRVDVRRGTWECRWTTILEGGNITVEGPFYDDADTVLAITGGTGAYANAQGDMELSPVKGEVAFNFVFNLT